MPRFFCNKCNRIVQDGDRHSCLFHKDNEIADNVRQFYETDDKDMNRDERIGQHAESLQENNRNSCETAQQIRNASQASTSNVENKELDGESFGESKVSAHAHKDAFAQEASFQAPANMEILDAGADQPLDLRKVAASMPGPSAIRHQTRGPDGMKLYVCDKCPCQYKHKIHLNRHYKKHTGEKNHVCDTCGKRFVEKWNLNRHQRAHAGEKPFKCKNCGKSFAQKQSMNRHYKLHTGERDFGEKKTLEAHLLTHTGMWPYRCDKCEKGFSQREHLDIHLRTHTGEKPFECQICGRRFIYPNNFRRHVEILCRGPYRCGQCGQTFSCNEDRNRHIMQQHP